MRITFIAILLIPAILQAQPDKATTETMQANYDAAQSYHALCQIYAPDLVREEFAKNISDADLSDGQDSDILMFYDKLTRSNEGHREELHRQFDRLSKMLACDDIRDYKNQLASDLTESDRVAVLQAYRDAMQTVASEIEINANWGLVLFSVRYGELDGRPGCKVQGETE